MNPRKRHVALALIALAIFAIVGSGAFSALTADRVASISVAGDDGALLAITPHSSADAQDVFLDSGELKIQVSPGTTTTYAELFNITNLGTQPIAVWITDHDYSGGSSGSLSGDIIGDFDENNTGNVTFFNPTYGGNDSCENGVASIEGEGNAVQLAAGETLVVGLQANTSDVSGEEADLLDEMTVYGDADAAGVAAPLNTVC